MSDPDFQSFLDHESPPTTPVARRETWLARYPRRVKLLSLALILALAALPPLLLRDRHAPAPRAVTTADPAAAVPALSDARQVDFQIGAPALNDQDDRSVKLAQAPDVRVTQDDALGNLPRIGEGGERPWQVYARPFDGADRRPRIAIVVPDLGLTRAITDRAIADLPPTVTLAFSAEGSVVGAWGARARADGHETLLQIPMEPFDYPRSDPGQRTLLTSLPNSDNIQRLMTSLRRMSGYVGITTLSGSRFVTDETKLGTVTETAKQRGLLIFDPRVTPRGDLASAAHLAGVPAALSVQRIGGDLPPETMAAALTNLEKTATTGGRAIAVVEPTPLAITQLQAWAKDLPKRGIALAPLSAMIQ